MPSSGHERTELPQAADKVPSSSARRVNRSCVECTRRKVKCDGRQPCGSCLYYRVPDACEYRQRSRRNAVSRRCVVRHASPDQRLPTASGQLTRTPLKHV